MGPYLGSGSILFHCLDDADILEPQQSTATSVLRLVMHAGDDEVTPIGRDAAFKIGRARIVDDGLALLKQRVLQWVLDPLEPRRLMALPVPGAEIGDLIVTSKAAMERFRTEHEAKDESKSEEAKGDSETYHRRFVKLQKAYLQELSG